MSEQGVPDIEVKTHSDLYPELKRKIIPVLELCRNIEEAFIVSVKEDSSDDEKPMLGLKYSKNAPSSERLYIREELRNVGVEMFADGRGSLLVLSLIHI